MYVLYFTIPRPSRSMCVIRTLTSVNTERQQKIKCEIDFAYIKWYFMHESYGILLYILLFASDTELGLFHTTVFWLVFCNNICEPKPDVGPLYGRGANLSITLLESQLIK